MVEVREHSLSDEICCSQELSVNQKVWYLLCMLGINVTLEEVIEMGTKAAKVLLTRGEQAIFADPQFNKREVADIQGNRETQVYQKNIIKEWIEKMFEQGYVIHVRVIDKTQSGSDHPVIYFLEESDVQERFIVDDSGNCTGFIDDMGNEVMLEEGVHVDLFYQPQSLSHKMVGLDAIGERKEDNAEPENVRLGGGVRLELEEVRKSKSNEEEIELILQADFVFQDAGPRATAKNCERYVHEPHYSMKVVCKLVDGVLQLQFSNRNIQELLEQDVLKVRLYVEYVLQQLFSQDGEAIHRFFKAVMTVDPAGKRHSLEAVFGLYPDSDEEDVTWLGRVTSFDGIDTMAGWLQRNGCEHPEHRLKREQRLLVQLYLYLYLIRLGFIEEFSYIQTQKFQNEEDIVTVFESALLRGCIVIKTWIQNNFEDLSTHINGDIDKHQRSVLGDRVGFTQERTEAVLLARLCKSLGVFDDVEWVISSATEDLEIVKYGIKQKEVEDKQGKKHIFLLINIQGFELVYWITEGEIRVLPNMHHYERSPHIRKELAFLFGKQIVRAHFGYMREGD